MPTERCALFAVVFYNKQCLFILKQCLFIFKTILSKVYRTGLRVTQDPRASVDSAPSCGLG